jgi:hypothetical protein
MHRLLSIAAAVLLLAGPVLAASLDIPVDGYVVSDDIAALPEAVRKKREQLLAAAASGDISALREVFDAEPAPPTVSFGMPDDPIEHLQRESGDGDGLEILAILANILQAPFAAMDGGDGEAIYIWPYLAAYMDIEDLTPAERVDAYRIMGYQQFEDMKGAGSWYYWRVFIAGDGRLQAFVAGD